MPTGLAGLSVPAAAAPVVGAAVPDAPAKQRTCSRRTRWASRKTQLKEVVVPSGIASKLAYFRRRRQNKLDANTTAGAISLSFTTLERELPSRQASLDCAAGERSPSARGSRGPLGRGPLAFVDPAVNKKIREKLLRQHWLTRGAWACA